MADRDDYKRRVAVAMMQAIFDAPRVEKGGKRTACVVKAYAVAAMIDIVAAILEGAPGCETPRAMRELTEGVGRKILAQMRDMRSIIAQTGQRRVDALYTRTN